MPSRLTLLTILASLLVGAGAGVVASIVTSNALENYANNLLGDRGFTALEPRKPNANPLAYDEAVRRARDTESRSVAVITAKTTDTAVPERLIGPDDAAGVGIVVSANGWILTTTDTLEDFQNPVTAAQVWVRGTAYGISDVVSDDLTPYVLLKLVDANGLTPVGFGASEDARDGDLVFILPDATGLTPTSIEKSEQLITDGPQPAETYAAGWSLSAATTPSGPVLSTTGDLLGFALASGVTIPFHHGASFVQEVIRTGASTHAALGAYVIDLSDIYNLDPDIRQGLSTGALVMAPTGRLAVPAASPAGQAGLLAHDIITAIDGEALTPNTSLAEILATYRPGQTARFSLVRGGAPIEIPVVLGETDALVY